MRNSSSPFPTSQQGSVIFYILIAIALFAALTYAVVASTRGNSNVSGDRLRLLASDVIATGNAYAEAVARLRLRNIAKNSISFENTIVTGYSHAGCTANSCRVFSGDGGGLSWQSPQEGTTSIASNWGFTGNLAIGNIGTASADVVSLLPGLPLETCRQINSMLGITSATDNPPDIGSPSGLAKYVGTTAVSATWSDSLVLGKKAACVRAVTPDGAALGGSLPNTYIFYQVLIAN